MSNENPLSTPQTVIRNGIEGILKCFVGKRNEWKDRPYQAFQIETDGSDSKASQDTIFLGGLDWAGKDNVKNALNTIFRRFGQDFVEDATGDAETAKAGGLADGVFSLEKFIAFWEKLKSSAMRLAELNEAMQSAVAEYKEFTATTLIEEVSSGDAVRKAAAVEKMNRLGATINSLQAEFDERKARRSKEAATETASAA